MDFDNFKVTGFLNRISLTYSFSLPNIEYSSAIHTPVEQGNRYRESFDPSTLLKRCITP